MSLGLESGNEFTQCFDGCRVGMSNGERKALLIGFVEQAFELSIEISRVVWIGVEKNIPAGIGDKVL